MKHLPSRIFFLTLLTEYNKTPLYGILIFERYDEQEKFEKGYQRR